MYGEREAEPVPQARSTQGCEEEEAEVSRRKKTNLGGASIREIQNGATEVRLSALHHTPRTPQSVPWLRYGAASAE